MRYVSILWCRNYADNQQPDIDAHLYQYIRTDACSTVALTMCCIRSPTCLMTMMQYINLVSKPINHSHPYRLMNNKYFAVFLPNKPCRKTFISPWRTDRHITSSHSIISLGDIADQVYTGIECLLTPSWLTMAAKLEIPSPGITYS